MIPGALTLQTEPVSGQVYAYGIYAQGLRDLLDDNPQLCVGVAADDSSATADGLERDFVRNLHDLLVTVHVHNRRHEGNFNAQKTLQAYTYDTYEQTLLTEVLLRRIEDEEVSVEALELFFYFQQPELIAAENQPADEVFFPVVVIGVGKDRGSALNYSPSRDIFVYYSISVDEW